MPSGGFTLPDSVVPPSQDALALGRIGWGMLSDGLFGARSRGLLFLVSVMAAVSSLALARLGLIHRGPCCGCCSGSPGWQASAGTA